jgi:hypothetical protein
MVDIGRYEAHPDCKAIVFFVYDPARLLINPEGLKSDFEKRKWSLSVKVVIAH